MKDLWSSISEETHMSRDTCKRVVFALLYTGRIIDVMKDRALLIEEVSDIRLAFNSWIMANCKRPTEIQ